MYFYDKAIIERIRQIIKDENVHIIPYAKMFTKSKDEHDNPAMPAISINREGYRLLDTLRNMTAYRHGHIQYDTKSGKTVATQSLPVTISYTMDVWTKTREQNDEFVRELIWAFTLFPKHTIKIEYQNICHVIDFNVFLGSDVVDNSDIAGFEDHGQYYRSSLTLTVDEARLFWVQLPADLQKVKLSIEVSDSENNKEVIPVENNFPVPNE